MPSVLLPCLMASAAPMEPVVLQQSRPQPEDTLLAEQTHMQQSSARYSVEVPQDEHLPLSFRRTEGPKGANLLNFSW